LEESVRIVYAADLHGNLGLYRSAGEAAERWSADAVVFGGDLGPGATPFIRTPQVQAEFLLDKVSPVIRALKQMRPSMRVFAIPGNDDFLTVLTTLEVLEQDGLVENLHRKAARLGPYVMVGLAFVPPTPFSIKDFERRDVPGVARSHQQAFRGVVAADCGVQEVKDFQHYLDSHPTIEDELAVLDGHVSGGADRVILVAHCPPAGTRCDVLYDGRHAGSKAIRQWIERRQPMLALHGHIHESPERSGSFADRIGKTIAVNPGSDTESPHLVVIELERLDGMTHSVLGTLRI
jgi:Icc-related predicted phosphoesterase